MIDTEGHVWIDGPDGAGYHCPVCGVSRAEDYGSSTCADILQERGQAHVERERLNWRQWLKAQDAVMQEGLNALQ